MLKLLLVALGFLISVSSSMAMEDKFKFDDPKQAALFLELTKVLRCPKCQNQNIADSDAMIAIDLKRKVHELVSKGRTKQEVVDYMKQRYGDFVFYEPPVNSMTIWLWLLPLIFIVATLTWIIRSRKKVVQQIDHSQLEKAQQILERDE
ncbi:cytochrome c-type biogenesis protein CcmH [Paraglaciecola aquimarina]|uniref:Cytochrome c-type biogenesis protein n=1 Tax=Paraglaciecola algarum TaxID=3050085 RepID=A0ABS9DA10_9ALTE|nr:cytochrome c-type biogenesis protein [Paraglaciecola sp. G1-23]MCF2948461.1 cytochrome c-type biogenesis protein CcmH [Paraglaciecola sp. G1-23]